MNMEMYQRHKVEVEKMIPLREKQIQEIEAVIKAEIALNYQTGSREKWHQDIKIKNLKSDIDKLHLQNATSKREADEYFRAYEQEKLIDELFKEETQKEVLKAKEQKVIAKINKERLDDFLAGKTYTL